MRAAEERSIVPAFNTLGLIAIDLWLGWTTRCFAFRFVSLQRKLRTLNWVADYWRAGPTYMSTLYVV